MIQKAKEFCQYLTQNNIDLKNQTAKIFLLP